MLGRVRTKMVRLGQELYRVAVVHTIWRLSHKWYMQVYIAHLRRCGIKIGRPSYIDFTVWLDPTDFGLITIEDDAIVARGVVVLVHDSAITQGLRACGYAGPNTYRCDSPVYIGRNVFVGINSILKPGTHLSEHCLVASGSVVQGRYEPYSIIAGNPAKRTGDVREWAEKKLRKSPNLLKDGVVDLQPHRL